jgi:EmrB/QacA subfamily drug resistance transporter
MHEGDRRRGEAAREPPLSSALDGGARADLSPRRRLVVTVALLCGTFLGSLDVTVVGTAMPTIAAELHGLRLYGWVFSAYLLASTVTVPIYGKLADLWGRRPAYLLGAGVFLLGSVACGLAPSMGALVAARALQGVGAGALVPITLVAIGDMYPVAQRVRVMSAFSLVWGVSSVIGPTVGGALVELGWPWVFLVNLPVGGVALGVLAVAMRDPPPVRGAPIDLAGAALVTAATSALLVGAGELQAGRAGRGVLLALAGVALALLFVRAERRAADPLLPPSLLRDPVIAVGAAVGVAIGGAMFAVVAFVPLWMRAVAGTSTVAAGAALIPMSLAWTSGAFVSGKIIARVGYRAPVRGGALLVGLGAAGATAGAVAVAPWAVVVGAGALGAGMGLGVTAANVVGQERVGFRQRGAATALLQFARTMGGTLLVSVLGVLLAARLAASLAGVEGAPEPSELVDPERAASLAPATLALARAALEHALAWVFAGTAAAGGAAFLLSLGFPHVALHGEARGDRAGSDVRDGLL